MKLLIIGGTYFLGKAFLEVCDDGTNEITVLNRGNRKVPGKENGHIREIRADRKSEASLRAVRESFDDAGYDGVIDFCAYEKGDIQRILNLGFPIKKYIFISTCDVYERGTGEILDEGASFEERDFGGEAGAYIVGKVALEKELLESAKLRGMRYTSVRPTFIYGPGNYAPREGMFFQWISKAGQIIFPEDADGSFQMVYVEDLAKCIYACLQSEAPNDGGMNVCGETTDYEGFADALEKATGQSIQRVALSVNDVNARGIPMPFPLTKAESERYSDERARSLGVPFTSLEEGLRKSYQSFLQSEE
ncbi:MAG: NAD-dependent epimerase/dehydratase family protein [Lachnospiraceae bacterium]|nr:NAD-dependent epimerase/dehydratase family protein [Lachnospiraceae bacterium]